MEHQTRVHSEMRGSCQSSIPFSLTSLSKHNFAKETRRVSRESTTEQEPLQFLDKGEEHGGKRVGKSIQLFPHWASMGCLLSDWTPSGYNPLLSKGISIQKREGGRKGWRGRGREDGVGG